MLKKLTIICGILFIYSIAHGQNAYVGIFAGASNYSGDLQPKRYTFQEAHPAFGLMYQQDITSHISYRLGFSLARISGNDKYSNKPDIVARNLSFRSNITEFQLAGEYDLWDIYQKRITPYAFLGVAVFHFNPTAVDSNGQRVALQPLSTEGEGLPGYPDRKPYNLTQIAIPFGGGIKYAITPNIIAGFEVGLRKTFTDYLDDVSTTYVDEANLIKYRNPLAASMAFRTDELPGHQTDPYPAEGTPRGSSKYNDWYYYTGFTLLFRLNTGGGGHTPKYEKCPTY